MTDAISNIVLIGATGVGKTTVGRILSKTFGWHWFDIDAVIEQKYGLTTFQYIGHYGVSKFREAELNELGKVFPVENTVFSLGAGSLDQWRDPFIFDTFHQRALIIWLKASVDTLTERLQSFQQLHGYVHAPYSLNKEKLAGQLARREPLYAKADISIETDGLDPVAVAHLIIVELVERFPDGISPISSAM